MASRASRGNGNEAAIGGETGRAGQNLTCWRVEGAREDGEVEVAEVGAAEKVAIRNDRGEDRRLSKSSAGAQLRGCGEGEQDT